MTVPPLTAFDCVADSALATNFFRSEMELEVGRLLV